MVQEDIAWFGPLTPNVAVTVGGAPPRNDAQVTAQSAPSPMTTGKSYNVSVTVKNTGTTTWKSADAYTLGAENPHDNRLWNASGRAALGATVAPGQQYTFSFSVVAPVPGAYGMQWKMLREGVEWFGGTSNSPVTVVAGTQVPAPALTVARTPSPMVAGQPFTLTWTSTNATSLTRLCSATVPGYTVNDAPATSGKNTATASSAWVGHPSTCNWKASGPGGTVQYTEIMSTEAAGGDIVTYIHTDGLGSPVARTDAAGNIISRTRYEPYGGTAGGVTPTIGFTGHVNDASTGLVYMQQRYYDPVAGRFLSIDPVTTDANSGSSFNRYAYANNSPYKYVDPDGRNIVDVAFFAYDVYRLGAAVAAGEGVGAAFIDVGISAIGVASPIPFVGEAIKGARTAERVAEVVKAAETGGELTKVAKTASGKRIEDYTRAQKDTMKSANSEKNGGQMACEKCGKSVENVKSEKGVATPQNQAQVHHTQPIQNGGTRETPGQVLCPPCHREEH